MSLELKMYIKGFTIFFTIFIIIIIMSLLIYSDNYERKKINSLIDGIDGPIEILIMEWSYFKNEKCLCTLEYRVNDKRINSLNEMDCEVIKEEKGINKVEMYYNKRNPLYLYKNREDLKCEEVEECQYYENLRNVVSSVMVIIGVLGGLIVLLLILYGSCISINNN